MSFASAATTSGRPSVKPIRQPAIENDFVKRVELDRAVERALGLEHRRRHVAVEGDVRVGEVVDEDELVLAREVDEPLHQLGRRDAVVGLCGNDTITTRGEGSATSSASSMPASTSPSSIRACTTVAPARRGATRWIG